jgi:hypothetical protein
MPVPTPVDVRVLVDTGASGTCLDPSIMTLLNLTPKGTVMIHTPSTGGTPCAHSQYDVSLILMHPKISYTFHAVPVIASTLGAQGIQGLLGRDVLKECLLIYDGPANGFTLAF